MTMSCARPRFLRRLGCLFALTPSKGFALLLQAGEEAVDFRLGGVEVGGNADAFAPCGIIAK